MMARYRCFSLIPLSSLLLTCIDGFGTFLAHSAQSSASSALVLPAVSYDGPLIDTDGALDLHIVEVGASDSLGSSGFSRPPIVLIHGLLGQSKNFGTWARDFKASHLDSDQRLFLVDLRNHGNSPHDPSMGYHHMAADMLKVIESLGCDSAVLIGHSMGGKVAMATALLAPIRVHSICVIDIAPVRYTAVDGTDWRLAEAMVKELTKLRLSTLATKREADSVLERGITDPMMRAFALTNVDQSEDDGTLSWRINLDAIADQLQVIAGTEIGGIPGVRPFTRPALFIRGEYSRYFHEEAHHVRAKGLFPASKVTCIDGAGHWVHVSKPTELHREIGSFLQGD